jgi:PAS domain S-box-containing protein
MSAQTERISQGLEFERLLIGLAGALADPPADQIETRIVHALRQVGEFLAVDFAALQALSAGEWGGQFLIARSVSSSSKLAGHDINLDCPWTLRQLESGVVVRAPDIQDLSAKAQGARGYAAHHGLSSFYALPLLAGTGHVAVFILGSVGARRALDADSLDRAQILGELLAGTARRAAREERLMLAAESAEAGLWSLDFDSMTFWTTSKARSLHGLDPTETLSLEKVLAVVHTDDRALIKRTIEQAAAAPGDVRVEYRVVLPNGTRRWIAARGRSQINSLGKSRQLMGACADITARKLAEAELHNARALTDAVFDSVPGLLYLYAEDGRLLRWNRRHEQMTGYTAEELLNFPAADWFTGEDLDIMRREWVKVFSEGHTAVELNIKLKDGTIAPYFLTGVRVLIDGRPHLVGIGIDVTERKHAERQLTQLRNELAHTTRVTTLGELASALAHELNQPLAAILSNAQAMRRWLAQANPDGVEVQAALEDIILDDKRAGEIIHSLRALMTKGEGKCERLDMNALIQAVVKLLHSELVHSEISLVLEPEPGLPVIEARQIEVQQVLLNLMLNGIDAQRATDRDERCLTVTTRHDAKNVIVAVRDCGTGIAAGDLPRLFEPFFSTKPAGLGMGLSICRRVAESNHGRIWAENNADRGVTFYFALPIAEDQA